MQPKNQPRSAENLEHSSFHQLFAARGGGASRLAAEQDKTICENSQRGILSSRNYPFPGDTAICSGTCQQGSGGRLHDTEQPVAFDAWHRLQIVCDPRSKTYRVLMQVIGEPPRTLCRGSVEQRPDADAALRFELSCLRAQPRGDGPAFDNVVVTRATLGVE